MAPTLSPRQTFRETVAAVAAMAKTKLPQAVNGRVESAVKLVLSHDVEPQADGSILVGSSSDPLKQYTLTGQACTCQDFERGQAPEGWCQHRIAAGIAKRVQALLPQSAPVETSPTSAPAVPPALPEAPAPGRAGMRLEAQVVIDGRQVKVALWGPDDADVQARLAAVLAQHPVPAPASPQAPTQGQGEGYCAIHNTGMHLNHGKDGRSWYSHRLPEGGFCKGKAVRRA